MQISHFLILLIPFYLARFQIFSIPTTVFEIVLYLVFAYFLFFRKKTMPKIPRVFWLGLVLWIFGSALGVFIALDKIQALGMFKGFIIDPILFFFILIWDSNLHRDKKVFALQAIKCMAVITGLISLASLIAYFSGIGVASDTRLLGIYALDSGASPNYLALFIAPVLPFYVYLFLIARNKFDRWYLLLVCLFAVTALTLTRSRAGLGAGLFGILTILIYYFRTKKIISLPNAKKLLIALWIIALAGLFYFSRGNLSPEIKSGRLATSNNIRLEIWKTTVKEIIPRSPLLGVGMGNFQTTFSEMTEGRPNFSEYIAPLALTPHNLFLNVWVNATIFGLIGLMLIIYSFIKETLTSNLFLSASMSASFYVILIHGLVDSPVLKNDLGALFFLIIGLGFISILPKPKSQI